MAAKLKIEKRVDEIKQIFSSETTEPTPCNVAAVKI
jgi:hypothetical protein